MKDAWNAAHWLPAVMWEAAVCGAWWMLAMMQAWCGAMPASEPTGVEPEGFPAPAG